MYCNKETENNKSIESIENIDIIKWAFETAYRLGGDDTREGVHINFSETQKFLLDELTKYHGQKVMSNYVCT